MIDSSKFELVKYRFPDFKNKGNTIDHIKGLDTEAYDNGEPFLCCLEDGKELNCKEFPQCFFNDEELINRHYGVYNLKYDSGALVYYLPRDNLIELWDLGKTKFNKFTIEYIPHKQLKITNGIKQRVTIWDIFQYYKMSLDNAAKRYLKKRKIDIETKTFTVEYVKKNFEEIKKYCIKDAKLVSELGNFLIKKLSQFGIRTTALYSGASLSLRYYSDKGCICTSWKYWKKTPELLKFAMDAYQGGKFEVTERGYFKKAYEYDLTSAYPAEIMNLYDLNFAHILPSNKYQKDATYGFIRIILNNPEGKYIPCGMKIKTLRVYPAGTFETFCTKAEYDYMTDILNLDCIILQAYWLFLNVKLKLYNSRTQNIFKLKAKYKNKDDMLYNVCKVMANSFYGKTVQMIEDNNGYFVAGSGWNPMYGAIITANCRLKVTKIQNEYKDSCIAVHTDSVILKEPLNEKYMDGEIGSFEYVTEGECILIACGQYHIGDKSAYKGFKPAIICKGGDYYKETWREILNRNKRGYNIEYPITKTESWVEAVAKGHFDKINLFYADKKVIDLNGDRKRIWLNKMKAGDFLKKQEKSLPLIVNERL